MKNCEWSPEPSHIFRAQYHHPNEKLEGLGILTASMSTIAFKYCSRVLCLRSEGTGPKPGVSVVGEVRRSRRSLARQDDKDKEGLIPQEPSKICGGHPGDGAMGWQGLYPRDKRPGSGPSLMWWQCALSNPGSLWNMISSPTE